MGDSPGAAELLRLVRRLLVDELLPLLPPERQPDARMVARAMAIAEREAAADAAEQVRLQGWLGTLGYADQSALCEAIRAGALDDNPALERWLAALVALKLG